MAKIRDYKALAAYIGRKKFGKEGFQRLSVKGRQRKARGEPRSWSEGGGKPFAAMVEGLKAQHSEEPSRRRKGRLVVRTMLNAKSAAQKARVARKTGIA